MALEGFEVGCFGVLRHQVAGVGEEGGGRGVVRGGVGVYIRCEGGRGPVIGEGFGEGAQEIGKLCGC